MIPDGMRDVLPAEAAEVHALEETLRGCFAAYGYGEVRTPTLELAETVERAGDSSLGSGFRLFDDHGRVLMLRTDMTVPIARLAATRYRERPLPLRFSYVSGSFRPPAVHRGQDGEFVQAGVELLGLDSPEADAEVVTLLCDGLAACGLTGFRVAIGSVPFHRALVASLDLEAADAEAVLEALAARDYPLLETVAARSGMSDEGRAALQNALELSGGATALGRARRLATDAAVESAVARLVRVRELIDEAGFHEVVTFDFGLLQDFTYYTGIVFEAYAPGVGFPIASGGRYDGLVARFGWDVAAVGWAIGVDRLHVALAEEDVEVTVPAAPLAFVGGLAEPGHAAELRGAGFAVAALPAAADCSAVPRLVAGDGGYVLVGADGRETRGGWDDVLRALGTP
jgi:ATP phosphoribosyltransferase regulatory subunit